MPLYKFLFSHLNPIHILINMRRYPQSCQIWKANYLKGMHVIFSELMQTNSHQSKEDNTAALSKEERPKFELPLVSNIIIIFNIILS